MPNTTYKPLSFWSWNGKLEKTELCEQIREFSAKGFGGFFMHARAGLLTPYMSEQWFSAMQICIEEAEKYGLEVWLYDEDGWPSGFGGGVVPASSPDFCKKQLLFGESVPNEGQCVCAYKKSADGYVRSENKEGDLYAYFIRDTHYADLLNRNAVRCFIENIYERYQKRFAEYFGKTVKGIFTDEPQLAFNFPYSDELDKVFYKRTGRVLKEQLWKLYTSDALFRLQYAEAVSELFHTSYTKQIADWCEKSNLIFTGHFAAEDGLCTDFTSANVLNGYPHMQMPGIDFLGNRLASPVLVKQVAAQRTVYGKDRILSESFGGMGWSVTAEDMQSVWGYQAALGMNTTCIHLSAYTIKGIRKRDYPAFFSYQLPWWNDFSAVTAWIGGVNELVSRGKEYTDTAVISPLKSVIACGEDSLRARQISNAYRTAVSGLIDNQVAFDILDEDDFARNGRAKEGVLQVRNGRYGMIVVPECDVISVAAAELLQTAHRFGVRVVFLNKTPTQFYDGMRFTTSDDWIFNPHVVMNRADLLAKYFAYIAYSRAFTAFDMRGNKTVSGLIVQTRYTENGEKLFAVYNREGNGSKSVRLVLRDTGNLYVVDPVDGKKTYVPQSGNTAEYTFPPHGITFLLQTQADYGKRVYTVSKENYLAPESIRRIDKNVLTIEKARYAYDGKEFSDTMPVIDLQDRIFGERGNVLRVEYAFDVQEKPDGKIELAAESDEGAQLCVNGKNVSPHGWWLDKQIRTFDITDEVKAGKNTVTFTVRRTEDALRCTENVFETERNRFFYPTEIENVYILGAFDVKATGELVRAARYYKLKNASFSIAPYGNVASGEELSAQNMYFYNGGYEAIYAVEKNGANEKTELRIHTNAALVEIYVNDKKAGVALNNYDRNDISRYLAKERNEVRLVYRFGNRNTLGPHHHIEGEPLFVGVHTFTGVRGFEDEIAGTAGKPCTRTGDTCFAPQIVGRVCIVKSMVNTK